MPKKLEDRVSEIKEPIDTIKRNTNSRLWTVFRILGCETNLNRMTISSMYHGVSPAPRRVCTKAKRMARESKKKSYVFPPRKYQRRLSSEKASRLITDIVTLSGISEWAVYEGLSKIMGLYPATISRIHNRFSKTCTVQDIAKLKVTIRKMKRGYKLNGQTSQKSLTQRADEINSTIKALTENGLLSKSEVYSYIAKNTGLKPLNVVSILNRKRTDLEEKIYHTLKDALDIHYDPSKAYETGDPVLCYDGLGVVINNKNSRKNIITIMFTSGKTREFCTGVEHNPHYKRIGSAHESIYA